MPELLEESIAEVKEESALVADTGEASGSTLADETRAEPVIECHESTAESSDKLEASALLDSGSEKAMVDESVADLEEPVAVLEAPSAAVPDEPVAVLEEPSAAVLEEPVAVLEKPSEAVVEEPVAALEEPSEAVVEEPVAALEEPSEAVVEESVAVLEEPSAAVVEEPVAVLEEPSAALPEETGALDDEPGAEHAAFESTSEAPELADKPIEIPPIEEVAAVLAAPIAEAADQGSVDSAAEPNLVADQVTETHDETARVDEADALV